MECRLDGTNTKSIYYIQTMDVHSWIIERIDASLVVTYIKYLGGERTQLEEDVAFPGLLLQTSEPVLFVALALVI